MKCSFVERILRCVLKSLFSSASSGYARIYLPEIRITLNHFKICLSKAHKTNLIRANLSVLLVVWVDDSMTVRYHILTTVKLLYVVMSAKWRRVRILHKPRVSCEM